MKLGIAYNVFDDSIELLKRSVASVRNMADYIVVVYQQISNTGIPQVIDQEGMLRQMRINGLIDDIMLYKPDSTDSPAINETQKRNLGLMQCKIRKCSHFMSMDCDEFYLKEQLLFAKSAMENSQTDASVCQMLTYYKSSRYILDPPETYYVPLIYKITSRIFQTGIPFPVLVDPTRRIPTDKFIIFKRTDIEMHHMTAVRRDFHRKLICSSAVENFQKEIPRLVNHFQNWKFPEKALMPGNPCVLHNVIETDDYFKIQY